jgi:hypothetical protein
MRRRALNPLGDASDTIAIETESRLLQGYDKTLCSLTMKRPDRRLFPQKRRRRYHTPIDEPTLIERSQLLYAIADDDDIEWKTDPFEMRPKC